MPQNDFNRDMDAYLRKRKTEKGNSFFKRGFLTPKIKIVDDEQEQPAQEDIPVEQIQAVMRGESVLPEEPELEYIDEDLPEQPPRRGFISRMTAWFSFSDDVEGEVFVDDEEDVMLSELDSPEKVDDDVKDMLRICVSWVNMLPTDKMQEIKRSDEYRKFKDLLGKYGLIKK